ncbi:hypothetical protein AA106555_0978 [Neokomagataea thailandica NBRC 106555]|uniref:Uncharacterized protein n=1 Tax=Neokomagataea thailandica NBRC 106555 TaxID=1223520 RepID=A0ABQ0QPN1_9PROT|nr:hypothetical protein AA106555_0978 [Neokomagataea thailandica NBRC 106555]
MSSLGVLVFMYSIGLYGFSGEQSPEGTPWQPSFVSFYDDMAPLRGGWAGFYIAYRAWFQHRDNVTVIVGTAH